MAPRLWLTAPAVVALAALAAPGPRAAPAAAEQCHVLDVDFLPAPSADVPMRRPLQIVAWIEDPAGAFVDTVFITRQTGSYGLGNRPGRFDFNSGPRWPYGRRVTVFPVWAHRRAAATGERFPEVVFQDGIDNQLSHALNQSSVEYHFCRPTLRAESAWALADAGTCASTVYTDKGVLGAGTSLYPPRQDVIRTQPDHASVDLYTTMNPFDAVSQATPPSGAPAMFSWAVPEELPRGDYVLWVEVAMEFDHNATYSTTAYPPPAGIPWGQYGEPYRGQPSVLYRVPFAIMDGRTVASTPTYAGYGDPDGLDGDVRPPDATITTADGTGAGRLALRVDDDGGPSYRVRVVARPELDFTPPAAPRELEVVDATTTSARVAFTAPGDDGLLGQVTGYEVRYVAGGAITEATFAAAIDPRPALPPGDAGAQLSFELTGLLFDTEYTVAVRAFDDCRNTGPIATLTFRTAPRAVGEVDACFVATAAYGSAMANDVELLRRVRDLALRTSVFGELLVEAYYTFGPALAGVVGESELLRASARAALGPVVDNVRGFTY